MWILVAEPDTIHILTSSCSKNNRDGVFIRSTW
jgi:hypothetical protein